MTPEQRYWWRINDILNGQTLCEGDAIEEQLSSVIGEFTLAFLPALTNPRCYPLRRQSKKNRKSGPQALSTKASITILSPALSKLMASLLSSTERTVP